MPGRLIAWSLAAAVVTAGCSGTDGTGEVPRGPSSAPPVPAEATDTQRHPDVIDVTLPRSGDGWRVSATISSPYDSPDRYADAFRVLAPDGTALGAGELLHDHANEQPFTRSLHDLQLPEDIDRVTVEGRDLLHGWGGDTHTVPVPR